MIKIDLSKPTCMSPAVAVPEFQSSDLLPLMERWLKERTDATQWDWLNSREIDRKQPFLLAFALCSRKVGREDLCLSSTQLQQANQARNGWNPADWSVDQLARTWLVLKAETALGDEFPALLDQLFAVGEVQELVTLYQLLPFLQQPQQYTARAMEGIRTNIKPVFCAVAQVNPFPAEQLSTPAWNQMILKALFIDATLDRIWKVDERANAELTTMLLDYADERFAASRPIPVELWRPVGAAPNDRAVQTLKRTFEFGNPTERCAAALAMKSINSPETISILENDRQLSQRLDSGDLTWATLTIGC